MLKIERSCDIYDLIKELVAVTGKTTSEVAIALEDMGLHPNTYLNDNSTVFITFKGGAQCCPSVPWLNTAIREVLFEVGVESITVTDND